MKKAFAVIVFAILSLFFVCQAGAVELLDNGDFQTGDLSGWDYSWNASVAPNAGPDGTGDFAATLSPSEIELIEKSFGPFTWTEEKDTNPLSALLVQELEGWDVCDIWDISFDYNLDTLADWGPFRDDTLHFGVVGYGVDFGQWFFDMDLFLLNEAVANGDSSGWQTWSGQADLTGVTLDHLYVGFFFADGLLTGGSMDVSSAFVDNVSFACENCEPVPEPGTMLLLGAGVLGLLAFGRKKFYKK